jgi:hypothetical protein
MSNYTVSFDPGILQVTPAQTLIPETPLADYEEFEGGDYEDTYGERRYYSLEVPGTIDRVLPAELPGIESGSSRVHVTIGMETVFTVDRFQTYRH